MTVNMSLFNFATIKKQSQKANSYLLLFGREIDGHILGWKMGNRKRERFLTGFAQILRIGRTN